MTNTIKKVIMVVPVLITNCQVSENLNIGPVTAQITITNKAIVKAVEVPTALVIPEEIFSNRVLKLFFFLVIIFIEVKEKVRPTKPDFFLLTVL
jgi:hypothetical protein